MALKYTWRSLTVMDDGVISRICVRAGAQLSGVLQFTKQVNSFGLCVSVWACVDSKQSEKLLDISSSCHYVNGLTLIRTLLKRNQIRSKKFPVERYFCNVCRRRLVCTFFSSIHIIYMYVVDMVCCPFFILYVSMSSLLLCMFQPNASRITVSHALSLTAVVICELCLVIWFQLVIARVVFLARCPARIRFHCFAVCVRLCDDISFRVKKKQKKFLLVSFSLFNVVKQLQFQHDFNFIKETVTNIFFSISFFHSLRNDYFQSRYNMHFGKTLNSICARIRYDVCI